MAEEKTYSGGCHCGAVRYEVRLTLETVVTCNCTICHKTGTVLGFAPAAAFQLRSGEEALTDYQFGKNRIHHLFCSRCGIRSFTRGIGRDGSPMVAINLRCTDDLDLAALTPRAFDGRSLPAT
ncbi:MAG: GFA family protein [Anaeromyxobacter sp.]